MIKSTCPGSGKLLMSFSPSDVANSAASEVERQSSASPHFSMTALHYNQFTGQLQREREREIHLNEIIHLRITLQLLINIDDSG